MLKACIVPRKKQGELSPWWISSAALWLAVLACFGRALPPAYIDVPIS